MCSGICTWITSAPQSASWRAAVGPARTCVRSMTRKRASAFEAGMCGMGLRVLWRPLGRDSMKRKALASVAALFAAVALNAGAANLRWSSQGDISTQDPHANNESFNNNQVNQVYDLLTQR